MPQPCIKRKSLQCGWGKLWYISPTSTFLHVLEMKGRSNYNWLEHEQNSICSQKHEHSVICRQLFAGHVLGSRPMKRKKHLHRMVIKIITIINIKQFKIMSIKVSRSVSDFLILR